MSCEWPVDRTCLPLPELGEDPSDEEQAAYDRALEQRNAAEDLAVHVLWALSGRQFGLCEMTVRPCPALGVPPGPYLFGTQGGLGGLWANIACGCLGTCTVTGPRVVHLPGPVATVTAVTIAGEVLDPSGYQLEGAVLYRKGGPWPRQDLGRPLGESGTWSVTYQRGVPVPPGVDKLTGELAKEFLSACDGDEDRCRLPRTLISTSRRGATNVFDPAKIIAAGYTGLTEVDQWLAAVNPHRLAQDSVVL